MQIYDKLINNNMQQDDICLGIDLGLSNLGFSIVGGNRELITYGIIKTDNKTSYEKRLEIIYINLKKIIETYKPNIVVLENIFHGRNDKTFMYIYNVQGIILLLLSQKNLNYIKITPNQVKKINLNKIKTTKGEMISEIRSRYEIEDKIIDDIADAIAISICY